MLNGQVKQRPSFAQAITNAVPNSTISISKSTLNVALGATTQRATMSAYPVMRTVAVDVYV